MSEPLRLVIAGLPSTGKTSLVKLLRGEKLERDCSTLGVDADIWRQKDQIFHLLDLGGAEAFRRHLWERFIPIADGTIFIIDGTDLESFEESYYWLNRVYGWMRPNTPLLILWNKKDNKKYSSFAQFKFFRKFTFEHFDLTGLFEGSITQNTGIDHALSWIVNILNRNRQQTKVKSKYIAVRFYSRHPEILLSQDGHHELMEVTFEVIQQLFLSTLLNLKYIPLAGGLYAVSRSSPTFYCTAIFQKTTPVDSALNLLEDELIHFERSLSFSKDFFPTISVET